MDKKILGIITDISDNTQRVETDSDQEHLQVIYMRGINYIPDAKVGDRVELIYQATSRYGLWFGMVI